jgi:putative IMPACT (imprinted ancient) family translation regulator
LASGSENARTAWSKFKHENKSESNYDGIAGGLYYQENYPVRTDAYSNSSQDANAGMLKNLDIQGLMQTAIIQKRCLRTAFGGTTLGQGVVSLTEMKQIGW